MRKKLKKLNKLVDQNSRIDFGYKKKDEKNTNDVCYDFRSVDEVRMRIFFSLFLDVVVDVVIIIINLTCHFLRTHTVDALDISH